MLQGGLLEVFLQLMVDTHYNNLQVLSFVNEPVSSNAYLIVDTDTKKCIVIDPGSKENKSIRDYIIQNNIYLEYIILTHEHFDHCWGVNNLLDEFNPFVIATKECAEWIQIPSNYFNKLYYNSAEMYSVRQVDLVIKEKEMSFDFDNNRISIFKTKGHSDKSACISINHWLFTGDTILYKTLPYLNKRFGASVDDLFESISFIYKNYNPDTIVFPGHGKPFILYEMYEYYKIYFLKYNYQL